MRRHGVKSALAALAIAAVLLLPAGADAAGLSFENKRLNMIISFPPGGGTDAIARLIGRGLASHLPGAPSMMFQNMPGADGINALNHFYARAEPDGLTLIAGAGNQLNPANLQREDIVKYDPTRLALIGGMVNDSSLLMLRSSAQARLTNRAAAPVVMGDLDGTRSSAQMALWGTEALGWNIKWVLGYPGTSDLLLALGRGEVDMAANSNPASLKSMMAGGEIAVFAQTGLLLQGKLAPSSLYPTAPLFSDMVAGKLTGRAALALEEWQQEAQIGKWFSLPPRTPGPILDTYREAWAALFTDAEFMQAAVRQLGPDFKRMDVGDLERLIKALASVAPETLDYVLTVRRKHGLGG